MIAAAAIPLIRRFVPIVLAVLVVLVTLEMIRRRKLREEYAMLWLGTSVVLLILAFLPSIPIWLQRALDTNYLTIVVMACFLFLSLIVMHFAVVISRHSEQIRQLAERMALLQRDLRGDPLPEERRQGHSEGRDASAGPS